ncbi:MAG: DUF6350 family protein [Actinomycetaceae bacterium]|nr:DUF6350 family protein [Actinomycetaceae bacterium]
MMETMDANDNFNTKSGRRPRRPRTGSNHAPHTGAKKAASAGENHDSFATSGNRPHRGSGHVADQGSRQNPRARTGNTAAGAGKTTRPPVHRSEKQRELAAKREQREARRAKRQEGRAEREAAREEKRQRDSLRQAQRLRRDTLGQTQASETPPSSTQTHQHPRTETGSYPESSTSGRRVIVVPRPTGWSRVILVAIGAAVVSWLIPVIAAITAFLFTASNTWILEVPLSSAVVVGTDIWALSTLAVVGERISLIPLGLTFVNLLIAVATLRSTRIKSLFTTSFFIPIYVGVALLIAAINHSHASLLSLTAGSLVTAVVAWGACHWQTLSTSFTQLLARTIIPEKHRVGLGQKIGWGSKRQPVKADSSGQGATVSAGETDANGGEVDTASKEETNARGNEELATASAEDEDAYLQVVEAQHDLAQAIRSGGRDGVRILLATMGMSLLALIWAAWKNWERVEGILHLISSSTSDTIFVWIAQLFYLPNAAAWVASWAGGPGFYLGNNTIHIPARAPADPIPAVPLLGAVPDTAVGNWVVTIPLVIGLVTGVIMARRSQEETLRDQAWHAATTAVVLAVGTGMWMWLSTGALGAQRLSVLGPRWQLATTLLWLEIGAVAIFIYLLSHPRTQAWLRRESSKAKGNATDVRKRVAARKRARYHGEDVEDAPAEGVPAAVEADSVIVGDFQLDGEGDGADGDGHELDEVGGGLVSDVTDRYVETIAAETAQTPAGGTLQATAGEDPGSAGSESTGDELADVAEDDPADTAGEDPNR